MDELITSFKAQMYEKARSPFLTAFMVSWVSWNLNIIIIIFGSGEADKKLSLLKSLNSDPEVYLGHWVLYPLLSASAFIFLYPIIALIAFSYWNFLNNLIKKIQVSQDDKVPTTAESARELRNLVSEVSLKKQEVINSLVEKNSLLMVEIDKIKGMIATLESEKRDLSKEIENKQLEIFNSKALITELQKNSAELTELKAQQFKDSLNLTDRDARMKAFLADWGININSTPEDERGDTQNLINIVFSLSQKYTINKEELKLLIVLITSEGALAREHLKKYLGADDIQFTAITSALVKKSLLVDPQYTGSYIRTSDRLRDYAYESGLLTAPDYKERLIKLFGL